MTLSLSSFFVLLILFVRASNNFISEFLSDFADLFSL